MKPETISYMSAFFAGEQKRYALCSRILADLGDKLSDTASFSPSYFIQVTVDNRDDLQTLMTLAPKWDKSPGDNGIVYQAEVEGERFQISALAAALPETCKMVEEEYVIPAVEAQPSKVGKRMVLKCDKGSGTVPVVSDFPQDEEIPL